MQCRQGAGAPRCGGGAAGKAQGAFAAGQAGGRVGQGAYWNLSHSISRLVTRRRAVSSGCGSGPGAAAGAASRTVGSGADTADEDTAAAAITMLFAAGAWGAGGSWGPGRGGERWGTRAGAAAEAVTWRAARLNTGMLAVRRLVAVGASARGAGRVVPVGLVNSMDWCWGLPKLWRDGARAGSAGAMRRWALTSQRQPRSAHAAALCQRCAPQVREAPLPSWRVCRQLHAAVVVHQPLPQPAGLPSLQLAA